MEIIIGVFRSILDVFKVRVEKEKIKSDFDLERMKLMEEEIESRMERLKEVYGILLNLAKEFSRDNAYIVSSSNMTRDEYNQRYLNKCKEELNVLMAIVATYFPQLNDLVEKLDSRINVYWGQQQDYLYKKEMNYDAPILMEVSNKLYESARYVEKVIDDIKVRLK